MANSTTSSNGNQIRIGYMRANRPSLPQPPTVNNYLSRDYIAPIPRATRSIYYSASVRPENEMGRANRKVGRIADPTSSNTTTGSQSIILGSRNINFTVPILSWSGRGGLGVSLALSYNSTAWIIDPFSNKLAFNSDNGFPSPGWRLGFGQLQGGDPSPGADWIPPFWNQDVAAYTYIWVEADGTRRTLIGGATIDTDLYLSNDSSQIEYNKQNGVMRLGGGTQVRFTTPKDALGQALGNEMLPSEIKDRNGNYIAITNEDIGGRWAITRIIDTLGRTIELRYENGFPIEIGQQRGGEWRSYLKLYYTGITIHTDFTGVEIDPPDIEGQQIVEPYHIEFQNGMNYPFFYTSYCQAYQIERWAPAIDGLFTADFSYDEYNRLTGYGPNNKRSYNFDPWGNLLSVTSSTGGGEEPNYSLSYETNATGAPLNNRIGNAGYSYDNAGNMTSDGIQVFTFDGANRLKTAGGQNSNYDYDGEGWRVKQTNSSGTIYYLWSGLLGEPVIELDGGGGMYRVYLYSPGGQMIGLQGSDGGFYWAHQDHLGSTRRLTDASGAVAYKAAFDPHGQVLEEVPAGSYLNSHKFTGYERDWATGIDNAKARGYHYKRGRFLQPDPLGVAAADLTNPQSLNRYSYVANDLINFNDPSGLYLPAQSHDNGSFDPTKCYSLYLDGVYMGEYGNCTGGGGGGFVGGLPPADRPIFSPDGKAPTPCELMAKVAQQAANIALGIFPSNLSEAVKVFDTIFSNFYLGGNIGNNLLSATIFYMSRESNITSSPAGHYSAKPYRGYEGFKTGFRDTSDKGRNDDQTHHAAAYINAGIRGQDRIALTHILTDDNIGDKKLGYVAFMLGKDLVKKPSGLRDVENIFLRVFCG